MKLKRQFAFSLLFAVGLSLLGACAAKKDHQRDDTVLNAYRLIDEQRTDEAITLLEDKLEKTPDNAQYKTVLASAYAHKAGIKIQTLVPAVTQTDKLKKIDEKLAEIPDDGSRSEKINVGALNLAALLTKFAGVFESYAAIPLVNKEQAIYLEHAIALLNDIGPQNKPEDVLYRAVLEIVFFKHVLSENLMGDFTAPLSVNGKTCGIDLRHITESVLKLGKLLIDIYTDIGIANPSQAVDMKRRSAQTAEGISNITLIATTFTVLDETSTIFFKKTAAELSFGKMIKCSE